MQGQVCLSTSPENEPTHWKQVICYLPNDDVIKVAPGDQIRGTATLSRPKHNQRGYDVVLSLNNKIYAYEMY